MNKKELAILEKAFSCEIEAALNHSRLHMLQTKSKIAENLVNEGLLRRIVVRLDGPWPCQVSGYELTHAGRLAYCMTC